MDTSTAPGTDADNTPATVPHDLTCIQCGYNLRALLPEGKCPECGTRVADSLQSIESLELTSSPVLLNLRRLFLRVAILTGASLLACQVDTVRWDLISATSNIATAMQFAVNRGTLLIACLSAAALTLRRAVSNPGLPTWLGEQLAARARRHATLTLWGIISAAICLIAYTVFIGAAYSTALRGHARLTQWLVFFTGWLLPVLILLTIPLIAIVVGVLLRGVLLARTDSKNARRVRIAVAVIVAIAIIGALPQLAMFTTLLLFRSRYSLLYSLGIVSDIPPVWLDVCATFALLGVAVLLAAALRLTRPAAELPATTSAAAGPLRNAARSAAWFASCAGMFLMVMSARTSAADLLGGRNYVSNNPGLAAVFTCLLIVLAILLHLFIGLRTAARAGSITARSLERNTALAVLLAIALPLLMEFVRIIRVRPAGDSLVSAAGAVLLAYAFRDFGSCAAVSIPAGSRYANRPIQFAWTGLGATCLLLLLSRLYGVVCGSRADMALAQVFEFSQHWLPLLAACAFGIAFVLLGRQINHAIRE